MLHELSHIFLTYLNEGKENTPPSMKASVVTPASENEGESGYMLDELVFGGTVKNFRDPIVGSSANSVCSSIDSWVYGQLLRSKLIRSQSGVLYIRTTTGVYRLRRNTIDKTVNGGVYRST